MMEYTDMILLLRRMIRARILIDFKYYREMKDLDGGVLSSIQEEELSDQLL